MLISVCDNIITFFGCKKGIRNMTSAKIQRKNTFLNWGISFVVGLTTLAELNATAGAGYQIETIANGLNSPRGICVSGPDLYIADTGNNLIKRFSGGALSTFAGGAIGANYNSKSPPTAATLHSPSGIFLGGSTPTIYFSNSDRIRRVDLTANTLLSLTAAGTSPTQPSGVWANSTLVYFADTANNSIKQRNASGTGSTTTIASGLASPSGVCADASFIYFSELGGNVKKIPVGGGAITTIASGLAGGSSGICIDSTGNILFLEQGPGNVKKIPVGGGAITTIASGLNLSGPPPLTGLTAPGFPLNVNGICVDSSNIIYIAESGSGLIRRLFASAPTTQSFTVAPGGSQTLSGTYSTAYITGGGTAVLPASNSISAVEVNNGTLQVSSSAPITFNASGGSAIVEILAAISTGAFTFNTPGAVKIGTGIAAILDAPSGNGLMSKTGAGRLRAIANLSSSTTPVAVSEGILEVSGTGKLPNAITTVSNGGTLQLGESSGSVAAGAVANASVASGGIMSILAGATGAVTTATIASGGIVSVAAGVTAPNGMFTSATFRSGGILQVADGATLGQSFTSVP